MASNHKLTGIIKGRTIQRTQNQGGALLISFTDGSSMKVKTGGNSNSASTGGTIAAVRQQDTTLDLDFVGGGTMEIALAEATSSVMLRDKDGLMEYAD